MRRETISIIFIAVLFLFFVWTSYEAYHFAELASFFPLYVSIFGAITSLIQLIISIVKFNKVKENNDHLDFNVVKSIQYMLWIIGYVIIIYIFGFLPATIIFLATFLSIITGMKWYKIILSIVIVLAVIAIISNLLVIHWPTGLIEL